jgi:hypothetical protein
VEYRISKEPANWLVHEAVQLGIGEVLHPMLGHDSFLDDNPFRSRALHPNNTPVIDEFEVAQ